MPPVEVRVYEKHILPLTESKVKEVCSTSGQIGGSYPGVVLESIESPSPTDIAGVLARAEELDKKSGGRETIRVDIVTWEKP